MKTDRQTNLLFLDPTHITAEPSADRGLSNNNNNNKKYQNRTICPKVMLRHHRKEKNCNHFLGSRFKKVYLTAAN